MKSTGNIFHLVVCRPAINGLCLPPYQWLYENEVGTEIEPLGCAVDECQQIRTYIHKAPVRDVGDLRSLGCCNLKRYPHVTHISSYLVVTFGANVRPKMLYYPMEK